MGLLDRFKKKPSAYQRKCEMIREGEYERQKLKEEEKYGRWKAREEYSAKRKKDKERAKSGGFLGQLARFADGSSKTNRTRYVYAKKKGRRKTVRRRRVVGVRRRDDGWGGFDPMNLI